MKYHMKSFWIGILIKLKTNVYSKVGSNTGCLILPIWIIQHNVLTKAKERKTELTNYYNKENMDIALLNETVVKNNNRIKIYDYIVHEKNFKNEARAGITSIQ